MSVYKILKKNYWHLKNKMRLVKSKKLFNDQFELFNKLNSNKRFENLRSDIYPCLNDATSFTDFDAHYIYHPAWAARVLQATKPDKHVDISSTLTFCAIASAFTKIDFYDYRPANLTLSGLTMGKADVTNLHFEDNSIPSISCMHTVEHIGLGRYGDPIDPDGDIKAMKELKRVCAIGGDLLFVVPVGKKKLMFNAHRIYDAMEIVKEFSDFKLEEFSIVRDDNTFITNADIAIAGEQNYGCGCFWFKKIK